MEYSEYKNYVAQLKIDFKQKLVSEEAKIKASILQTSAKKYKSHHAVTELEQELSNKKKMKDPVKVEDVLRDKVLETAFPNIQRLLKIYLCIPQSEAVVEHGFSKMNLILTKKMNSA